MLFKIDKFEDIQQNGVLRIYVLEKAHSQKQENAIIFRVIPVYGNFTFVKVDRFYN